MRNILKSMTAYGRGEIEFEQGVLTVELKALNNRYKDIILRLPSALQEYEDFVRSEISSRVKRGRVEVSMQLDNNQGPAYNLELNRPLLDAYGKIYEEMNKLENAFSCYKEAIRNLDNRYNEMLERLDGTYQLP